MPVLGLGTFKSVGYECKNAVSFALQNGYSLIDTAQAYQNEEQVGAGIKESGVGRENVFIVTKVNFKSYENAAEVVCSSLSKLGTDYLDMVLLHWPFGNYYAAYRELEKLYEEGKIRAIGVSNFAPDRLIDLIHFNKIKPAVNQTETHLYCQRQSDMIWEEKYGVAHMSYAPLGQSRANEMFDEKSVKELAAKYGKTPAQILLKANIQSGAVVIPKSVNFSRIKENIDIFDFELAQDEMSLLRALDKDAPMIGNAQSPEKTETAMGW